MIAPPSPFDQTRPALSRYVTGWLLAVGFWVVCAAIVAAPLESANNAITVTVGESAPQDILAPVPQTYASQVLTDRARVDAEAAVPDVYDQADARIAREQVLLLRDILDYIASVRADAFASTTQKRDDLLAMQGVTLESDAANLLLSFDQAAWNAVRDEALVVLEQMMRAQVRADQVEAMRRAVPARISVNLSEAQAVVVDALVSDLLAANSFYNEAATIAARQAARDAVAPVYRTFVRGQAVVEGGKVVSAEDVEALEALGLMEPQLGWREPVSAVLATFLAGTLVAAYVGRFSPDIGRTPRKVVLLGVLFVTFLLAARLMVPGRTVLPFLYPASALAMLLTVFAGVNLAIVCVVALAGLVGFIAGASLELTLFLALGSIVAAMTVGRGERVNQFFWAGLAAAAVNVGVLLAFRLPDPAIDPLGLAQLVAASVINGAVSASLTLAGFFILGGLFDITTSLQLIELSRPDHPLLRLILRTAPGTYQHSLQVANLAEQAAERIGANAMLVRVGALYHDCGKALRPQYFVENQLDGGNIHESLAPLESAQIIISHVTEGLAMARRHRLPTAIQAFIAEHHGTLRTMYQYGRAVQAAGGDPDAVPPEPFTYPGPAPQTRETALLMLADGCEAKARADRPKSEADIDRIVRVVMEDRLANGQLDATFLTLHDLQLIRASFVTTLKGVFHPRLTYPEERPALAPPAPETTIEGTLDSPTGQA